MNEKQEREIRKIIRQEIESYLVKLLNDAINKEGGLRYDG